MTKEQSPLSIVMPVRNGYEYIKKSVAGILENIEKDDEVLIIDDGSTDQGIEEISPQIKFDNRFRVIKNPKSGIVSALNLGVNEASHNWIARFDVDDEYPVARLSEQRKLIATGVAAIFCDYSFFSTESSNLGKIPSAITSSAVPMSLYSTQRTPHPGVLFNRESFQDVGGYREEDRHVEDLSLWLRMTRNGKLISVPKQLLRYRITKDSTMGKNRIVARTNAERVLLQIGLSPSSVQNCVENIGSTFQAYDQNSDSSLRKLLLLRELFIYRKSHGNENIHYKFLAKLALEIAKYPDAYVAGVENLNYRRSRARFRKSF